MFGKTLKSRMKFSILIEVAAVTLVMGITVSVLAARAVTEKTITNASQLTEIMSVELQNEAFRVTNVVPELLQNYEIYDLLEMASGETVPSYKNTYEIKKLLRQSIFRNRYITGAAICFENGNKVQYINGGIKNVENAIEDCRKMTGGDSSDSGWQYIESDNKVKWMFYTCGIYNPVSYKKVGTVIFCVDTALPGKALYGHLSEDYDIMVASADGVIYSTSDKRTKIWNTRIKPYISSDMVRGSYNDNISLSMVTAKKVNRTDWDVLLIYSYGSIYRDAINIVIIVFLMACISGLIILFVGSRLNDEIVKPLYLLYGAMKDVDADGIAANVEYNEDNEYGFVIRQFNHMNKRIRNILDNNYKKQLSIKNLQMKVLQSQISPHFLFNTLQSIHWMAHFNKSEEVAQMILDLSKILEYALRNADDYAALCCEAEYIDKYMDLIKFRYDGEILFESHIEPEVENCLIPKLLIQPLVENCVNHAKKNKCVLTVRLRCYIDGGCLVIDVTDNGKGINPDKLSKLRDRLENTDNDYDSEHIGLENISGRIKNLYGKSYGVYIDSKETEYTSVRIVMPVDKEKSVDEL